MTPKSLAVPFLLVPLLVTCHTVEHTGRRQLLLLPESTEIQMGLQAFEEIKGQLPLSTDREATAMVERVGTRLAGVVERQYEWEFRLFASEEINAFALPGGKIGFFEGILPICQNEDGVAAVMGHEIAHVMAHHGNERVSQHMGLSLAMELAELGLGRVGTETRNMAMAALGAGATLGVVLPYSRAHESEADELGLRYMIRAGYDPHEAVRLWERMAALSEGQRQPEFFSTHPDPGNRARRLEELIPRIREEEMARLQGPR